MAEAIPVAGVGRWRAAAGFLVRTARRTLLESLYLLTGPLLALAGLLLAAAALGVRAAGLLLPGGSRVTDRALVPVRWFAGLERRRIDRLRPGAVPVPRLEPGEAAADPGLWLDLAYALVAFPVALVTATVTALWWFTGLAAATVVLRHPYTAGPLRPLTLGTGGGQTHVAVSLGIASPSGRAAFGTVVGLLVLCALPLVTRACLVVHTRLAWALLSGESALHRRISGLERERDTARAQTAAALSAEATALRRLERDLHDGPQQRLVRLAMELGRAQHHFETRPDAAREALADALVQAQETLEELRVLSRGIAPPILADRGLPAALEALAARCTVPAVLDTAPLAHRPDPAVETAAYFTVAEALTNVAKHSQAARTVVGLRHDAGTLRVWVSDDGVGGAAVGKGHGLAGLAGRLHATGGRLHVTSPAGGPTTITAELPCP